MHRETMEARVDELRAAHPDTQDFVRAVKRFSETLDVEGRDLLGKVLLSRKPESGGFDVLEERMKEGGWVRRTMRKMEEPRRRQRP